MLEYFLCRVRWVNYFLVRSVPFCSDFSAADSVLDTRPSELRRSSYTQHSLTHTLILPHRGSSVVDISFFGRVRFLFRDSVRTIRFNAFKRVTDWRTTLAKKRICNRTYKLEGKNAGVAMNRSPSVLLHLYHSRSS